MEAKITLKERISYSTAGMGQNMVYILSSSFLMMFYTDIFKIKPWIVGTLFLVAKLWDAVNDFIMGSIADNTRTRWGKLRPYLLFAPIPIAILTILTFHAPDLSEFYKAVYVFVTYILWGMAYTVGDIPYWGLSAAMSSNTEERTKLITVARLFTMIGTGIAIVAIPIMYTNLGSSQKEGFLITAIIISVVGCGLFSLAFFGTKERVVPQAEKTNLLDNIVLLVKNTPLLIILLASFFGVTRFMSQAAGTYVTKYNLNDEKLYSVLGGTLILSVIIAIAITPLLLKFTTKRNLFIITSFTGGIIYIVMYFLGYDNLILVFVMVFFSSLSMGFFNVLQTAMIADSVDYLEWKTGKRAEGLCYAGQTFFFKASGALSNFVMGLVLTYTGFNADLPVQNPEVYGGTFGMVSLIPGIGCLLSIIPMLYYKYNEEDQKRWVQDINKRKASEKVEESLV